MRLRDKISEDLIAAMKAREADRLSVLRMMKTAVFNRDPAFQLPNGAGAFDLVLAVGFVARQVAGEPSQAVFIGRGVASHAVRLASGTSPAQVHREGGPFQADRGRTAHRLQPDVAGRAMENGGAGGDGAGQDGSLGRRRRQSKSGAAKRSTMATRGGRSGRGRPRQRGIPPRD